MLFLFFQIHQVETTMFTSATRIEKYLAILMMLASFVVLWVGLIHPIVDGDIWFHLLYGKVMVEQGSLIVDHTQFSWTPASNDITYCAWIGELLYYFLFTLTGETGVIVFRYFAMSIPFLLLVHIACQRKSFFLPTPWLAAIISVLALVPSSMDKPELISLVFMSVLVWNWFQIRQLGAKVLYNIYLFPLIILIWVNTHGIFTFGCVFLLILGIGETCNQFFYPAKALPRRIYIHLMVSLSLSALMIFCTPYGLAYIEDIISLTLSGTHQTDLKNINAWKETFDIHNKWLPSFANSAVLLVAVLLFVALKKRKLDFVPVLINVAFAYFFTVYIRLTYLWVPVFILTVAYYAPTLQPLSVKARRVLFYGFFSFFSGIAGWSCYLIVHAPPLYRWGDFGESEFFTIPEEINYIANHYGNARLGNLYSDGAYILWQRWPQQKVMIDARQFPYASWSSAYFRFTAGQDVEEYLKKYPFELAVIDHSSTILVHWFARSVDWQPVFYGKGAILFKKGHKDALLPPERGKSLSRIKGYGAGAFALLSTIELRDWQGFDTVLNTLKASFGDSEKAKYIEGMAFLKPATQAYDKKDFLKARELFQEAANKHAAYPQGLSAAALAQSVLDWQEGKLTEAVQGAQRALFTLESFQTVYNLAVMGWQLDEMKQKDKKVVLALNNSEREILAQWPKAMAQVAAKENVPEVFKAAQKNAKLILARDAKAQVFFLPEDWM